MLKYRFNKDILTNDTVEIKYDYATTEDFVNVLNNTMMVTLYCDNVYEAKPGDALTVVSSYVYYNDLKESLDDLNYVGKYRIFSVDSITNKICFVDSKYTNLDLISVMAEVEDGVITIVFDFDRTHTFSPGETPIIYLVYNGDKYVYLDSGVEIVDCTRLRWVYDDSVYNATNFMENIFLSIDLNNIRDGEYRGLVNDMMVTRHQIRWNDPNQENPRVYINQYKIALDIPLSLTSRVDLYKEENINEYFVQDELEKCINNPTEMEKHMYTPVIVTQKGNNMEYTECSRINFNLHFREHSGKSWTVENSDTWNFVKYGENGGTQETNKYYSYGNNSSSDAKDKWNVSCQSDLLTYADFKTNDVKYQKNKLKKSFIRLSFYDSPNPGSQNLLAYSTVFVDCNKLYSKFISKSGFNCYFDQDGDLVKGIKVDREVSESALKAILGKTKLTKDEIEEYRLSTQLSVQSKYSTENSSEGFYLYLWENDTDRAVPSSIYMKVEYNHAGYGRNIPMMAPYITKAEHDTEFDIYGERSPYYDKQGFKTNKDIAHDWSDEHTQYGIKKYLRYSYIHLKTKYDTATRRYIYYIDPDTYGLTQEGKNKENIININLYEARVAFND